MTNSIRTTVFALLLFFLSLSQAGAATEKVVLTSEDGYRITGSFTKGNSGIGVVLLHMYRNNRQSWQPLIKELSVHGISSLAIDMRGHGESRINPEGKNDSNRVLGRDAKFFSKMHLDAEAAVRYLVGHGVDPDQIGLVGASVGCSVAVHTVSVGKVPVSAVVLMTPGMKYLGVPTMDHIRKWPSKPMFILTSEEEEARGAAPIYAKLKDKGASLKVFQEEDIHGTNMFGDVEDVETIITDWLVDKLSDRLALKSSIHKPIYRVKLRVHLASSSRMSEEFEPILSEINEIWQAQAGICFEIHTVYHDTALNDGLDMWFSPHIGGYNGYYDGEYIQMTDAPVLSSAPNPAKSSAARTAAHELGHALDLPHRQDSDDNLMRSKTYGYQLNVREIQLARETAADIAFKDSARTSCNPPLITRTKPRTARLMNTLLGILKP